MINNSTIDKLIEMRLGPMADAYIAQMNDKSMQEIPFDDRFGMLVDILYVTRKNNTIKRIIHNAQLEQPDVCIAGIDYTSGRKLNKFLIQRLASCEYIADCRNIFITGATGSCKTYMACAFGMESCKQGISTKYVRLPDLLIDLDTARNAGNFTKILTKYTKPKLLILDEWLLMRLNENEWYNRICTTDSPMADAIMDRISYDSYKINIESIDPKRDLSMRKVYGLDPKLAE